MFWFTAGAITAGAIQTCSPNDNSQRQIFLAPFYA